MITDILSEKEFCQRLGLWVLDNDKGAILPHGMSREEFAGNYRMPDFDYVHMQTYPDENGDLITVLKSGISLRDWETRNSEKPAKFEFYKLLKTFVSTPDVEPYPMGYVIIL